MNAYEKHRGVGGAAFLARGACPDPVGALRGVSLLSRFPMRESVLRSIARFVRPGWAYGALRMRILGITFFFASLFCAAAPFCPAFAGANGAQASSPDNAADLRAAKESFDAGDYVSARKTLQPPLEKSTHNPDISFSLARSSYQPSPST